MKQIYTIIVLLTFCINLQSQVGIGTDTPNPAATLDVDGKTNVTDRIYIGDENLNQAGNPGSNNQLIISGGDTASPVWDTKKLPDGYGETFTMTYMNSGFDTTGVQLGLDGSIEYPEGMPLNSTTNCAAGDCWKVLPGLTHTFPIYKDENKVNFTFQTTVQANAAGTLSYGCGIFLNSTSGHLPEGSQPAGDFRLVGTRLDALYQVAAGDYKLFNMNVTLQNLEGDGGGKKYTVKVACRGRATGNQLFAGRPRTVSDVALNTDMSRSALNIFVLESWE